MAEKVVSLKVAEETVRDLEQIARYYGTTHLSLAKKLLEEGLRKARLEYGADLYSKREATLERAAEAAGVTLYEMMAYLRERGIASQRGAKEIREDTKALLERLGWTELAERLAV